MCNTPGSLLAMNFFHHDFPAFDNASEELMAENPAVKEFLQPFEAGELAAEERHEEQFDAAMAAFRGSADSQSADCAPQSSFQLLFPRI